MLTSTEKLNLDMIGQEINIGDYIVYTNNIYKVIKTGKFRVIGRLINPSPSTRNKEIYKNHCVVIDKFQAHKYIHGLLSEKEQQ